MSGNSGSGMMGGGGYGYPQQQSGYGGQPYGGQYNWGGGGYSYNPATFNSSSGGQGQQGQAMNWGPPPWMQNGWGPPPWTGGQQQPAASPTATPQVAIDGSSFLQNNPNVPTPTAPATPPVQAPQPAVPRNVDWRIGSLGAYDAQRR